MAGQAGKLAPEALEALRSRYVDVDGLPWIETHPGIKQKVLFEDRARGMRTALIRWAPGAELPLHEHTDVEQTFVLEGSLVDHEGACNAGDFVWRPAGSRHRAWTPDGCLLLAVFLKPNKFFEAPGHPSGYRSGSSGPDLSE